MFRDLIAASKSCNNKITMDLSTVIPQLRALHETEKNITGGDAQHTIPPTGFVFHESRCGSTLVANSLAAVSPSKTRVYSESAPPLTAMTACGEDYGRCDDKSTAVGLLKDVVYLMGRTNREEEEHLFFKVQSIGTRSVGVVREAFPETPWIFVHRDPVQVMMSHRNCLRDRNRPSGAIIEYLEEKGLSARLAGNEEYCAAHLATLCKSALAAYKSSPDIARIVDYKSLPNSLIDSILPNLFHVEMGPTETDNILKISGRYSKGRGGRDKEWVEDSEKKEKLASDAIKDASRLLLEDVHNEMNELAELN